VFKCCLSVAAKPALALCIKQVLQVLRSNALLACKLPINQSKSIKKKSIAKAMLGIKLFGASFACARLALFFGALFAEATLALDFGAVFAKAKFAPIFLCQSRFKQL